MVFVAGAVLWIPIYLYRGMGLSKSFLHPYVLVQLAAAAIFYVSTLSKPLNYLQPLVFLTIAPINFLDSHESFYGLGFFVMAVLLLFKIGFFERGRIPKILGLLVYLYGWELFAAFKSGRNREYSLSPVFFVTVFLIYLYILYKEKIIVYLKQIGRASCRERV